MVHAEAASQGYDAARNGPQSESSRHGGAVVRGAPDSECGLTPAFRPAEKAVITSKADMFSRKADGSLTVQIPAPGEDRASWTRVGVITAIGFIAMNLIADILYVLLNPRMRAAL